MTVAMLIRNTYEQALRRRLNKVSPQLNPIIGLLSEMMLWLNGSCPVVLLTLSAFVIYLYPLCMHSTVLLGIKYSRFKHYSFPTVKACPVEKRQNCPQQTKVTGKPENAHRQRLQHVLWAHVL